MQNVEVAELAAGLVRVAVGTALGFLVVYGLARRVPWPARGSRLAFVVMHLVAAPAVALVWGSASIAIGLALTGSAPDMDLEDFVLIGSYLYLVLAAITYSIQGASRASRAEATAARMQLAALRSQIHPHFLFNALHSVVQLIPVDPDAASEAAEQLAELLRWTLDDERDVVQLGEEWRFVERYLELERIRFGDRLRVHTDVDPELFDVAVPSFALQTLVENAVRHGAATRVEPTDITIRARGDARTMTLTVTNPPGAANGIVQGGASTGLRRLRERLDALHGERALLTYGLRAGDFQAVVVIPRESADET